MEVLETKKSKRGLENRGFFNLPANKAFLIRLAEECDGSKWLMMTIVYRVNQRLCGYILLFLFDNRLLAYQTALINSMRV